MGRSFDNPEMYPDFVSVGEFCDGQRALDHLQLKDH